MRRARHRSGRDRLYGVTLGSGMTIVATQLNTFPMRFVSQGMSTAEYMGLMTMSLAVNKATCGTVPGLVRERLSMHRHIAASFKHPHHLPEQTVVCRAMENAYCQGQGQEARDKSQTGPI